MAYSCLSSSIDLFPRYVIRPVISIPKIFSLCRATIKEENVDVEVDDHSPDEIGCRNVNVNGIRTCTHYRIRQYEVGGILDDSVLRFCTIYYAQVKMRRMYRIKLILNR